MRANILRRSIWVLLFFLLGGCAQIPSTPAPTTTPTVQLPSPSNTPTPSPGRKIPQVTILPSWTPTITPTPTETPIPSATFTFTPTPDVSPTATPPGMALLHPFDMRGSSPDGKWLWAKEEHPGDGFWNLHIVSADGKVSWIVHFTANDIQKNPSDIVWYQPILWLPKEPYVYLIGEGCRGDGPRYYVNGFNLARFDLLTGKLSVQIAGDLCDPNYFSFSPGGKYLLTAGFTQEIKIILIKDWSEITYKLPASYTQSGDADWSTDQKMVILESCVNLVDWDCAKTQLLLLDVDAGNYRVLMDNMQDLIPNVFARIHVKSWISDEEILIKDEESKREWIVNVNTGKVTQK